MGDQQDRFSTTFSQKAIHLIDILQAIAESKRRLFIQRQTLYESLP